MAGKIWRYDCYDIRKFGPEEIDYLIDIGANVGSVSLMGKVLHPKARVISIEPCKRTFDVLVRNMSQWRRCGIECYNMALGNGSPMSIHERGGEGCGMNRCYSDAERNWWRQDSYTVESKTLGQMFVDFKIDESKNYIIKIDCEGGERFIINDPFREESLRIIRKSVQTMMEIHFGLGGSKEQWNKLIDDLRDTHNFKIGMWKDKRTPDRKYVFEHRDSLEYDRGNVAVEFVRKDFDGR